MPVTGHVTSIPRQERSLGFGVCSPHAGWHHNSSGVLILYVYIHFSILINIPISILTWVARDCMPQILLYSLHFSTHHIHIYLLQVNSDEKRETKL